MVKPKIEKDEAFETLNRLGKRWNLETPEARNAAMYEPVYRLCEVLVFPSNKSESEWFQLRWDITPGELTMMIMREVRERYTPEEGELGPFVSSRLPLRWKDIKRDRLKKEGREISIYSEKEDEEDHPGLIGMLQSTAEEPGRELETRAMVLLLANIINLYPESVSGKMYWFRLCYTEKIRWIAESEPDSLSTGNMTDILKGLDNEYLAYFGFVDRKRLCEAYDIACIRFKSPAQMGYNSADDDPVRFSGKGWLPAAVPIGFNEKAKGTAVSDAAITKFRKAYLELIVKIFREKRAIGW